MFQRYVCKTIFDGLGGIRWLRGEGLHGEYALTITCLGIWAPGSI